MQDGTLLARLSAGMKHFYRVLGSASDGARVVEGDGVFACVVPVAAERSYPNGVLYDDAGALAAAYPRLERTYGDAGVRAWTVWVPSGDTAATRLLARRGHVLDATPVAMGRALAGIERPAVARADAWSTGADPRVVGALNDRAYGLADNVLECAYARVQAPESTLYVATLGGEPVSCLCSSLVDGNCEIDAVATLPAARGRGIAGELLGHALADAAEQGATTTTLVATKLGRPVYERAGYGVLGVLEMWERRAP